MCTCDVTKVRDRVKTISSARSRYGDQIYCEHYSNCLFAQRRRFSANLSKDGQLALDRDATTGTAPPLVCTQPWRHSPHWDTISPCHERGVLQSIVNTSNNIIFVQAGRFIFFNNTALGILELKHGILHFYLFQCQDGFNLSFQLLIGFPKELDFFLS